MRKEADSPDGLNDSPTAIEAKRSALSKTGKMLAVVLFLVAGLFAAVAVASAARCIVEALDHSGGAGGSALGVCATLLSIAPLCVIVLALVVSALVFRDISRGESPFTHKQVKRIRLVAWLMLAYAVLDAAVPRGVLVEGGQASDAPLLVHSYSSSEYYGINVGLFVMAMVFFFLSSVFKYGVELQELSDEIV